MFPCKHICHVVVFLRMHLSKAWSPHCSKLMQHGQPVSQSTLYFIPWLKEGLRSVNPACKGNTTYHGSFYHGSAS